MKLKKMAFLILISGGILYGICTDLADAGALYIYETGNPTDTGYAGVFTVWVSPSAWSMACRRADWRCEAPAPSSRQWVCFFFGEH